MSSRFIAWGHSQGGHASLFAGLLARRHAPELDLLGVAAAAPATDLTGMVHQPAGTVMRGQILPAMVFSADLSFTWTQDISTVEPWRTFIANNMPGILPADVPVLLAQGEADATVRPETTAAYMQRLCKAGGKVRGILMPGIDHHFIAHKSADQAVQWMDDRFAGKPAPNDCPRSTTG
jgi:acetyl esterase/lipase